MNDMILKVNITTLYTYYILNAKVIKSIFISSLFLQKNAFCIGSSDVFQCAMSMKKLTCNEVDNTHVATQSSPS